MLIAKRLAVWLLETLAAAVLLGILLFLLQGPFLGRSEHYAIVQIFAYAILTLSIFMWGSGYLLTTAAASVALRTWRLWLYPAVAAGLFVVHVEFFAGGWTIEQKLPLQILGACGVFGCNLLGNFLARRWEWATSRNSVDTGALEPSASDKVHRKAPD